jgi:hypothetical protein
MLAECRDSSTGARLAVILLCGGGAFDPDTGSMVDPVASAHVSNGFGFIGFSIGEVLIGSVGLGRGLTGDPLCPGPRMLLSLGLRLEKAIEQGPLLRKRVRHKGLFAASHQ